MPASYEEIFGNLPPRPGYANSPASQNIETGGPEDYAQEMQGSSVWGGTGAYGPSAVGGSALSGAPPQMTMMAGDMSTKELAQASPEDMGAYARSYPQNWQAPHTAVTTRRSFVFPNPSGYSEDPPNVYGPSLPRQTYDPAWLGPITPGQPGWRTPPSPSGPHPRSYSASEGPQPPIYTDRGGGPVMIGNLLRHLMGGG